MEIEPTPRRPLVVVTLWRVLVGAALAPLLVLVVVPSVLGFERFVVTTDAMTDVPRGSLVYSRQVPGSDLRPGDVITFHPPGQRDELVTRQVASIIGDQLRTMDDAGTDPWTLSLSSQTHDRMVTHVPWAGYPFVGNVDRWTWSLLVGVPALLILLASAREIGHERRRRTTPVEPAPQSIPAQPAEDRSKSRQA